MTKDTTKTTFLGRRLLTEEEAWDMYFKARQKRLDKQGKS